MLRLTALLPLLGLIALPSYAQQPGQWTMNASIPQTNPTTSGCAILAQLTSNTTPPSLQAFMPICPSTTPVPADPPTGATVHWPLTGNANDGQGIASDLLIYGQVTHKADRTDVRMAQAGCVMRLTADQAQYLLGRSLTWNNNLQELWDNTGSGFVLTPSGNATLACGKDAVLLPESLWLPDPYIVPPSDVIWQEPLQLTVPKGPVNAISASSSLSASSSAAVVVGIHTSSADPSGSGSASASNVTSTVVLTCTSTDVSTGIAPSSENVVLPLPSSSADPIIGLELSSSAPPAPTITSSTIGGGLIGVQPGSNATVVSSSAAAASSSDAGHTMCEKETVTERYTTTVTAVPSVIRRYPPVF